MHRVQSRLWCSRVEFALQIYSFAMLTAHEVVDDRVDGASEVAQPMRDEREVGRSVTRILQQIGVSATNMAVKGVAFFLRAAKAHLVQFV